MKPTWQTPEFWATLVSNIVGIIALLGYVTPEQSTALTTGISQIAGLLLMIATSFGFIKGQITMRTALARAVIERQVYEEKARLASVDETAALLKALNL